MECMIEIENLSLTMKKQVILSDINLTFEKGKIHGLIGRNGSGKTMLMKCILGFIRPSQGTIWVDHKKIGKEVDFPPHTGVIIETPGFILLLFATLGAKKAGVITGFLVIAAGICFCATSSRFKFLFPMANSLLGVHYTRYYREMVFPLSLSAYYFIGLLAVILFVAFIRCKKMNYNFDHEID